MTESNSKPTPMIPLGNHKDLIPEKDHAFPYKQAVGELLYVANISRPNITFAVNYSARQQTNPMDIHFTLIKRILRYLKHTPNAGILYRKTAEDFEVYVDADFAGDPNTRRSTTGFLIYAYGCLIGWATKLQPCLAESSGEAEYIALNQATHELLFITQLCEETVEKVNHPVTFWEDNTTAIGNCITTSTKSRLKHVELLYFKCKELYKKGLIKPHKLEVKSS